MPRCSTKVPRARSCSAAREMGRFQIDMVTPINMINVGLFSFFYGL
jgi:hypothetical protein